MSLSKSAKAINARSEWRRLFAERVDRIPPAPVRTVRVRIGTDRRSYQAGGRE